jgi:ornithine cyclodeaminase
MTQVFQREQIVAAAQHLDTMGAMEKAFVAYSAGRTVIPPVGHLSFDSPPGDTCIKYGYERGADTFVVKIASGFYDNPNQGLPASTGIMLIFSQQTGLPQAVLLDGGYLTDLRTAAAGAVAAKHVGPAEIEHIGIVGTGTQARMQLLALRAITSCRTVSVWGRHEARRDGYCRDMREQGFTVEACSLDELTERSNLIVTTTPSQQPLLTASRVRPGTHITAVGADGPGKQELPTTLFARAHQVVADSVAQCSEFGEMSHALKTGDLEASTVTELGAVIAASGATRDPADISIADLTGVAIQDVAIATAIFGALTQGPGGS